MIRWLGFSKEEQLDRRIAWHKKEIEYLDQYIARLLKKRKERQDDLKFLERKKYAA